MPKVIPGLEDKIRNCSQALFMSQGYSKVSMKTVADEVGTSVGNLYNYFPSKTLLFMDASRHWWTSFQDRFQKHIEGVRDPRRALVEGLMFYLNLFESSSGLMEDFIITSIRELGIDESRRIHKEIRETSRRNVLDQIGELLTKVSSESPQIAGLLEVDADRLASSLIAVVKMLAEFYTGQDETNRLFLSRFLDSFLD